MSSLGDILDSLSYSKNKMTRIPLLILFVFAFVPLLVMIYIFYDFILELLVQIDQTMILINIVLAMITIIVFVTSLLQVPSIYYYAMDTEFYLAMPVRPYEILGAKFLNTLIYQYVFVLYLMGPLIIALLPYETSIIFYFFLIIISLFLPVLPLLLSSLIIMFMMNFLPFLKNKNFMNILIGLFTIGFTLFLSFGTELFAGEYTQETIYHLLQQGSNSLAMGMFRFIPTIGWSAKALNDLNLFYLLLVIGLNILLFVVYVVFAQGFYLNGAQGVTESARNNKVLSKEGLRQSVHQQSPLFSLIKRECLILLRTPSYLLNNVLITILLPLLLFTPLFFTGIQADPDMAMITDQLNQLLSSNNNLITISLVVGFGLGVFSGGTNTISATSISRDAYHLDALKSYPIKGSTLILSKVLTGTLVSLVTIILTLVVFLFMIELPSLFYLLTLIISILSSLAFNAFSIIPDLISPKLNWTNENQAVKQNMNSVFTLLLSMVIPVLFVFLVIRFNLSLLLVGIVVISLLLIMFGSLYLYLNLNRDNLFNYL